MHKLDNKSIELLNLNRAQADGQSPAVHFRVLENNAVSQFISESSALGFLWGNLQAIQTARLNFQFNDDNSILTVRRSVGPNTMADASNNSLADAILTLMYDAQIGEAEDIYSGLTGRGFGHYVSSVHIQSLYHQHYQIEGYQHPVNNGL